MHVTGRGGHGLLILLLFILSSGWAQAAPRVNVGKQQQKQSQKTKREVPNYDGRETPSKDATDVALWVPKILALPLYAIAEYGLRRPLGALVATAEENHWFQKIEYVLSFGREDKKIMLIPTAFVEFGLKPSVGLDFRVMDLGVEGNTLKMSGAMWPTDWWAFTVVDHYENQKRGHALILLGKVTVRPDHSYYGLGPDANDEDEAFYSRKDYEIGARFKAHPWRRSVIEVASQLHRTVFSEESSHGTSLRDRLDEGVFSALPPGFDSGYTAWKQAIRVALDTRQDRSHLNHGSGVRFEANGEYAVDMQNPTGIQWVRYGGKASGFVDVTGTNRVVSLSLDVQFADPIRGEIPFTEMATLGGEEPFVGYRRGRFYGRSSAVATVEYRWPVWAWLDMSASLSVGNVFGEHLEGWSLKKQRASASVGLKTHGPLGSISLLLGVGTDTFENGFDFETTRFFVRGQSDF